MGEALYSSVLFVMALGVSVAFEGLPRSDLSTAMGSSWPKSKTWLMTHADASRPDLCTGFR
jgi:hypothetical protein